MNNYNKIIKSEFLQWNKVLFLFLAVCSLFQRTNANVKLPALFSDHMVLQQGMKVPVWGWADPYESVVVKFAGQTKSTKADGKGNWMVKLNRLKTGKPQTMIIHGKNTIVITDVQVGEVWICSGQSNMEWALSRSIGGDEAVANSANANLRIFNVPHNDTETQQRDVNALWSLSGPKNTKYISAIGYWFLSKLQKELGVPVGFINASYGGTVIEAWISRQGLEGVKNRDRSTFLDSIKADYIKRLKIEKPIRDKYEKDKLQAKEKNLPAPPMPVGLAGALRGPTMLFNGEIAPLIPYAIHGVAWYQGESNAYVDRANSYQKLLSVLIKQWRTDWGMKKLPFLIFQLAPNRKNQTDPNEKSGIAVIQEAQLRTTRQVKNTALIITMDLGENNVHYLNKEPVGERAMKAALSIAYHKNVDYSGPIFKNMKIKGNKVIIGFTNLAQGLVAKGDTLHGFTVAGNNMKFYFADARIVGNMVVVSSPDVPKPVSVRYGWADFPKVNLFNKKGFPASPFRTDDWPLPTNKLKIPYFNNKN